MKKLIGCLLTVALLIPVGLSPMAYADATSAATADLKDAIDRVITTLQDEDLAQAGMAEERRKQITAIVKSRFDFYEMTKRALGRHWKKITEEEQTSFVALFTELLSASYMGKIEGYTDEKVVYERAVEKRKYVWVETVVESQGTTIPIVYRMLQKNGSWWVYDVVIEEVSLVSTYRTDFNKTILRESYGALVKKLERKLEEIRALDKADKETAST